MFTAAIKRVWDGYSDKELLETYGIKYINTAAEIIKGRKDYKANIALIENYLAKGNTTKKFESARQQGLAIINHYIGTDTGVIGFMEYIEYHRPHLIDTYSNLLHSYSERILDNIEAELSYYEEYFGDVENT